MSDRLKESFEAIIEAVLGRRVDRTALYPARVVAQAADGTLEVMVDDERFSSMTKIPIRTPFPETSVKVQPGARALIGWEGADPAAPYASLWQSGSLQELAIGNAPDFVALAGKVDAELEKISTTLLSLTGGASAPAAFGTAYTRAGVGATKVKAE